MPTSDKLKEKVFGKKVAVLGIGVSNTPVIDMLLSLGAHVSAHDIKEREALGPIADELEEKGVHLVLGKGYLDKPDTDIIFRAPGIRPDHHAIVAAVENGAILTSEMSEFFDLCPAKIIAVTGSDGKTTTTTIISKLLEAEGKRVFLGGNIGRPLLPIVDQMTSDDWAVVELSSFQLQTMRRSPDVAVITNITPNHLNWHVDMDEYIDAKLNILRYQSTLGRAVLNFEDPITRAAADIAVGEHIFFTSKRVPDDPHGYVYEKDGGIYLDGDKVIDTSDIMIPGRHNVENYMAAIAATKGIVSPDAVRNVATSFGGVEHRNEFVRELDGVKYYNSSIDSSPTRTIAALRSYNQKLIVLCGGYDKNIPYEPLAEPLCERAKLVIITGATAPKIMAALEACPTYKKDHPTIVLAEDYGQAVDIARERAESGDIVLLSPASASFDAFKNFEERGNFFKNKVNSLK